MSIFVQDYCNACKIHICMVLAYQCMYFVILRHLAHFLQESCKINFTFKTCNNFARFDITCKKCTISCKNCGMLAQNGHFKCNNLVMLTCKIVFPEINCICLTFHKLKIQPKPFTFYFLYNTVTIAFS